LLACRGISLVSAFVRDALEGKMNGGEVEEAGVFNNKISEQLSRWIWDETSVYSLGCRTRREIKEQLGCQDAFISEVG